MSHPEAKYFVHPSAIVDQPVEIGEGTKIWHFCHIMAGARIGRGCSFGQNCFVAAGVVIGNNVKVQNNVSIYEGVELEDHVFCGPSIVFTNIINPRSEFVRHGQYKRTLVGCGATIGANATILAGNKIGAYAFIGAGAVVTQSAPPYSLLVGVPAKKVGWMSRCGHRLVFGPDHRAVCAETGEVYLLTLEDSVHRVD